MTQSSTKVKQGLELGRVVNFNHVAKSCGTKVSRTNCDCSAAASQIKPYESLIVFQGCLTRV